MGDPTMPQLAANTVATALALYGDARAERRPGRIPGARDSALGDNGCLAWRA